MTRRLDGQRRGSTGDFVGPRHDLHPEVADLLGKVIEQRYRIDEVIGLGGMAAVFRAHHLALGRDVAIKVICPLLGQSDDYLVRFEREARLLSRLDHPNCVRVIDFGRVEGDRLSLVMEYVQGVDLQTELLEREDAGDRVSFEEAVDWTIQILEGLEHAHRRGIIHRDIKPENLVLTNEPGQGMRIKIIDFGLALLVVGSDSNSRVTAVGEVFGTPEYMSPEQVRGEPLDHRSDLYSVGCLLYLLCSGRLPFESEDAERIMRMQALDNPPPLPIDVPAGLVSVIERLMAKESDRRYQSAGEAAEDLRRFAFESSGRRALEFEAVSTVSKSVRMLQTPPAAAERRLRRVGWAWLGLGLGLLAVLVTFLLRRVAAPTAEFEGAPDPFVEPPPVDLVDVEPQLAELDRRIARGDYASAQALLDELLDQSPEDGRLLWRAGRLTAVWNEQPAEALLVYQRAVIELPSLLHDPEFFTEITTLMRHPLALGEGIDVALRDMQGLADGFLLELVNRSRQPLSYVDRHRVLDHLRGRPESAARIDRATNVILDLVQAAQAPQPCAAYAAALHDARSTPTEGVARALRDTKPPRPRASIETLWCAPLDEFRASVSAEVEAAVRASRPA